MTPGKRALDLTILVLIAPLILPIGIIISLAILITDGRPIVFKQERMKTPTEGFLLWKFRTMRHDPGDTGVSGGDKADRITPIGRILRRTHFDEVAQAVNLLRGDVSLVGPRPPLRMYVERCPEIYADVLKSRPGLTGIASYFFSRHEAWILRQCKTAEETDAAYVRRCIPRKARLDMIYQRNVSVLMDLWLFWITAARILKLPGGRPPKITYRKRR